MRVSQTTRPLLPRKARALLAAGWKPPEQHLCERKLTRTLPEELESLADFRKRWDSLEGVEDVDREKPLPADHPEWWFRMQHYDTGDGTRLLDVTTSLTAALLFACINWASGAVDDTTDGIVYLWAEGTNGNVDDFLLHRMPATAEGLFSGYPDAPRYILNPPHNERSKPSLAHSFGGRGSGRIPLTALLTTSVSPPLQRATL